LSDLRRRIGRLEARVAEWRELVRRLEAGEVALSDLSDAELELVVACGDPEAAALVKAMTNEELEACAGGLSKAELEELLETVRRRLPKTSL